MTLLRRHDGVDAQTVVVDPTGQIKEPSLLLLLLHQVLGRRPVEPRDGALLGREVVVLGTLALVARTHPGVSSLPAHVQLPSGAPAIKDK